MDVSIIIISYNTCNLTLQCLYSIYENVKEVDFEVIIVDNASTDNSVICIKEQFSQVVLVESSKNLGFGAANNLGSKYATGKYLFLLNSDTILLNNAIKIFYERSISRKEAIVYGTWLLDENRNITHSYGNFLTIWTELKHDILIFPSHIPFLKGFIKEKSAKEHYGMESLNVDYITGADLFMPKDVFDKSGQFDIDFFMYFEDTDLQKRLDNIGIQRVLIEGPLIIHYGAGSQRKRRNINSLLMPTRSFMIYMKKHNTILAYIFFRIYFLILKSLFILCLSFSFKEKLQFIKLLCYGK